MAKNNPLIVIFTAFLVQTLIFSLVKAAATNITTDQHALLALKDHLTYDPANLLAKNWSTSSSICTWIGVTCGVRHHRVTVLNISYFGLAGTLPPQLGNLSFLQVLAIKNNSFSGSLPDELAQLRRLKRVNFMFNSFYTKIPSRIGSLSKLQQFLSGGLPSDICNYLPSLKMLHLSGNMFDGQIPSTISKCQQLQMLSLSINNFTGYIPKEIGNISMLKELYLDINKLQGVLLPSVGGSVALLSFVVCFLRWLCMFVGLAVNLGERTYGITCDSQNNRIIVLNLTSMSLTGAIPPHIGNLSFIVQLRLRNNSFHGSLPMDIVHLHRLEIFHLGLNSFQGEISSWLGSLPKLQILYLFRNNFTGTIPPSLGNITTLKNLACTRALINK
ncbi:hypothetical protein EZV62_026922 [Acer yangbiense]|uniref:Leucine-rich repeat-containing N-terminal plant-type domain-containing protein n=1 Tax=Acer yangbiense TaxID=1000413 RepID=A0A5C7GSC7_9ROSI|nr:hypothetical protein EZV62_026922 [Acer yangbiense]